MSELLIFAYPYNGLSGLYDYLFVAGIAAIIGGVYTVYQQVSVRGDSRHKLTTAFFCLLAAITLLAWLTVMTVASLTTVAKIGWSIGLFISMVGISWGLLIISNADESSARYRRITKLSTYSVVSVASLIALIIVAAVVYGIVAG